MSIDCGGIAGFQCPSDMECIYGPEVSRLLFEHVCHPTATMAVHPVLLLHLISVRYSALVSLTVWAHANVPA
jgi:hypothetical protein